MPASGVHLYAHCLRDRPGGVAVLAINFDRETPQDLAAALPYDRYTLTSKELLGTSVELNGRELKTGAYNALPEMAGKPERAGRTTLAPASITFLAFPNAGNASCR